MDVGTDAPVTFLLNKIDALVSREWELQTEFHNDVQKLRSEFRIIKPLLTKADDAASAGDKDSQLWVGEVRELAYDIEDGLDMYTSYAAAAKHRHLPEFAHPRKRRSLAVLVQEINAKREEVRQTRERYSQLRLSPSAAARSSTFTNHYAREAPLFEAEPVGVDRVLAELMDWAGPDHEPRLKIRFVVGMGGLGKTVVVKQLYNAARANFDFDCFGWIHGSRSQTKEQVLTSLLVELRESGTPTRRLPQIPEQHQQQQHQKTVHQLMQELTSFLQHKKYLIVWDDLWSRDLWESIKCAFPTGNHSRVVITTRRGDIAHLCCYDQSTTIQCLRRLSESVSKELFFRTAFSSSGQQCPPNLSEWAKKLLAQCDGWPLGIVIIGKYASRIEPNARSWKLLHDGLGSEIQPKSDRDDSHLSSMTIVLSASYFDLPYYLKYCLLYFSIFPEGHSVRRRRLIRMWVSEGLVKEETGKTPEEVGERYLKELIQRSLVEIDIYDFDGRPKTCRLHPILHKIILSIAQQDNFCCRVSKEKEKNERVRRLSITNNDSSSSSNTRSFPRARSLLVFESHDSPVLISSFKVLKVLDLEGATKLDQFPAAIVDLVLLRYLSLRSTHVKKLPRWIWKLPNLETLDLKHTFVTSVPAMICRLAKLRHLLIYRYVVAAPIDNIQGFKASVSIRNLVSLQKLTCIRANGDVPLLVALGTLTKLKKLGILELREEDCGYLCSSIEKMHDLQTLNVAARDTESLNLNTTRRPPKMLQRLCLTGKLRSLPNWLSSLHDLVRVRLRLSRLEESPIDALEDLPNLMELQLVDAYGGNELVFRAGKFQNLKALEVDGLEFLERLVIEGGSLQSLQRLIMRQCKSMVEQFPGGIGRLSRLEELHLYGMPRSLVSQIEDGGRFRPVVRHIKVVRAYSLDGGGRWQLLTRLESPAPIAPPNHLHKPTDED